MRTIVVLLLSSLLTLAGPPAPADAQSAAPQYYAVTYFDVAPALFDQTAEALRAFAAATRKEDGNIELTLLDEVGRSGRFAILEAWRDKAAYEAHAPAVKALSDKLLPLFSAPFGTRPYLPLSVAPPPAGAKLGTAMYVLTHIDVFPAGKDEVAALVKQLADDSRKDKGEQRFDALVWDGHPNHFELVEAWSDHLDREAHAALDHTGAFRAKLAPFEGGPYDERLYEVVP